MAIEQQTDAFRLIVPEGGATGPLVFATPHSGRQYPDDAGFAAGLGEASLRSAEDAFVDQLIDAAPGLGVPVLEAVQARAWLDLNRAPEDQDPVLVGAQVNAGTSARAKAGFGVVPRLTGDGAPLYPAPLTQAEVERRITTVHAPYHAALDRLMGAAHERHGVAILIDWHSMPGPGAGKGAPTARWPGIVLGDRHGTSCATALTRRVAAQLRGEGLSVGLNHPYAGGWTTENRGRPGEGWHALQIELSRSLYLDEARLAPGPGWSRTRGIVTRLIETLVREAGALVR